MSVGAMEERRARGVKHKRLEKMNSNFSLSHLLQFFFIIFFVFEFSSHFSLLNDSPRCPGPHGGQLIHPFLR